MFSRFRVLPKVMGGKTGGKDKKREIVFS